MSVKSTGGISFSPSVANLLDRGLSPGPAFLSENQREVDRLVENAVRSASDGRTMATLFSAGLVGRLIRLGSLSSLESLPSLFLQGSSRALGLAGESAVFASLEQGFGPPLGGSSFQQAWANAALSLGCLKLFGGLARGENLVTQHLLTDLGFVAGHQLGSALNLNDRPQGSLARQMLDAEGMNLALKGSLALLHGAMPGLSALEGSVDLSLRQKGGELFSSGGLAPLFPNLEMGELAREGFDRSSIWMAGGEGPKKPPLPRVRPPAPPSTLGAGPPVPPPPSDERPTVPRNPIPRPAVPRPAVPRPAGGSIPEAPPAEEPRVRLSFTPPVPSSPIEPMSQEQILTLSRAVQDISPPELQVMAVLKVAGELSHGGFKTQAKEYFDYAASLLDVLPDSGSLKGRVASHMALEQALAGDQAGCKESFGRAMGELNRLQRLPQRSLETMLQAYGLVFTLAGDLIGAGRMDTATQLLKIALPNYQRILKGPLPLQGGQEAILKLASLGHFEGALTLAGQIPSPEGQRKALLELGVFYAHRHEMKKADEILWRLRGSAEKEILHGQVAQAYAQLHDWTLTIQNLSMVKNTSLNLYTAAQLTRIAYLSGRIEQAHTVQEDVFRVLKEWEEGMDPQSRGEIFALLAANAALWADAQAHTRFYYQALNELEPWLTPATRPELSEQGRNGWAELLFGLQLANQGEKAGELMKDLEVSERAWLLGQASLKLAQVGRSNVAIVWLGLIPEAYRSGAQKQVVRALLDGGYADRAFPFAEKIPDFTERFDTLWEFFSRHRGAPLVIAPRRPPPLPGSQG